MDPQSFHAALQAQFAAKGYAFTGGQNNQAGDGWYRLHRNGLFVSVATRRVGNTLLLAAQKGRAVPHPGVHGVGWTITNEFGSPEHALSGLVTLLD